MKKIKKNLRIAEIDGLSSRMVTEYHLITELSSDEYLRTVFYNVERLSGELTTAIKRSQTICPLSEADKLRNSALRSLSRLINGYAELPTSQHGTTGARMKAIFSKYGLAIVKETYTAKSSLIESLLEELSENSLRADIDQLMGASHAIYKLRDAENNFQFVLHEYDKAKMTALQQESATSIAKRLVKIINSDIVPYINIMLKVDPARYSKLDASLNLIVERTNARLVSKKENDEKDVKSDVSENASSAA